MLCHLLAVAGPSSWRLWARYLNAPGSWGLGRGDGAQAELVPAAGPAAPAGAVRPVVGGRLAEDVDSGRCGWLLEPVSQVPVGPSASGPREWRRRPPRPGRAVEAFLLGDTPLREAGCVADPAGDMRPSLLQAAVLSHQPFKSGSAYYVLVTAPTIISLHCRQRSGSGRSGGVTTASLL